MFRTLPAHPEDKSGKPKLVRFLIPVYREKSTKPEASVGTEDKGEQGQTEIVRKIGSPSFLSVVWCLK